MISKKEQHESYGMISLNRFNGGDGSLYGCAAKPHTGFQIEIHTSYKQRELAEDRYFADKKIVRLEIGPDQLGNLLSSMNRGDGIPCTLRYLDGKTLEQCPDSSNRQAISDDFKASMVQLSERVDNLIKAADTCVEKAAPSKTERAALRAEAGAVKDWLAGTLPFILSQFHESMEGVIREAKADVDNFARNVKEQLGAEALQAGQPVQLPA
jgi:hypothetical protein